MRASQRYASLVTRSEAHSGGKAHNDTPSLDPLRNNARGGAFSFARDFDNVRNNLLCKCSETPAHSRKSKLVQSSQAAIDLGDNEDRP